MCLAASALVALPAGAVAGPPGATPPAGGAAGQDRAGATPRATPPANIVYPDRSPAREPMPRPGTAGPPGAAGPGAYPASPPVTYQEETYRGLVLLADVAWMWAAWQTEEPLLALGGYLGAAPLMHVAQKNSRSAWISAGARAGALLLTVGIIQSSCSPDGYCDEAAEDALMLGVTAMGAVMVVDWLVLGKKRVPVTSRPAPTWAPQVSATAGGLRLGVAGAF